MGDTHDNPRPFKSAEPYERHWRTCFQSTHQVGPSFLPGSPPGQIKEFIELYQFCTMGHVTEIT